jgi:biopolymer transport protein ExbD
MTRTPRRILIGLAVSAGLLASGVAAWAQDNVPDHDVVIEIDEQSVTYNGAAVAGLHALEEVLVGDVEADPQLTVKVLAHDAVPIEHIMQIVDAVRQYEVECEVEIVSSTFEQDDNM